MDVRRIIELCYIPVDFDILGSFDFKTGAVLINLEILFQENLSDKSFQVVWLSCNEGHVAMNSVSKERLAHILPQKMLTMAGLEPAIPRSEVCCLFHQATRRLLFSVSIRSEVQQAVVKHCCHRLRRSQEFRSDHKKNP